MKLKVDKLGRVVLPKPLRQRYGLRPGTKLDVAERAGEFALRSADQKPSMVKIGGWWVHQGAPEGGVDLSRAVAEAREERDVWNLGLPQ